MATTAEEMKSYPIPVFRYQVTLADEEYYFTEVSGLDIAYEPITYKDGLGMRHMPGMPTPVNISLQRGVFAGASELYEWVKSIKHSQVNKRDLTVSFLDEDSSPLITWKVFNAFPTNLSGPSFSSSSNDVAVESLELMADRLEIDYAA